jgi:uncharacterized protein (TIGR04255 family)
LPTIADLENPPIYETLLGVWFSPITSITPLVGLFKARVGGLYPNYEPASVVNPPAQFFSTASTRALYRTASRDRLIQFQDNMFFVNWQRLAEKVPYPRYEHEHRPRFGSAWIDFCSFLSKEGYARPTVQCAHVGYINNQELVDGNDVDATMELIFDNWRRTQNPEATKNLRGISATLEYGPDETGGSLQLQVNQLVRRTDQAAVLQFSFASIQPTIEQSDEAILQAMDRAHDRTVVGFFELTNERTRKELWKEMSRRQA